MYDIFRQGSRGLYYGMFVTGAFIYLFPWQEYNKPKMWHVVIYD